LFGLSAQLKRLSDGGDPLENGKPGRRARCASSSAPHPRAPRAHTCSLCCS